MRKIFLYLFLIGSVSAFAQSQDAHLWMGAGVSGKLSEKLSVGYESQVRLYKNASTVRVFFNQVGGSYEIVDDLKVGLEYRFARKRKDNYFVSSNRFMFNTSYGYKIDPISTKFKIRLRYQNSFDRLGVINETILPNISNVIRAKVSAKYKNVDFKRVQPFVAAEIFKSLNPEPIEFGVNAYRLSAGIFFDLPFKNELKVYYIYQQNYGVPIGIRHIYSFQYNYKLGNLLKK